MRRPPPLSIDANNLANDGETPTSASGSAAAAPSHPIPMSPVLLSDTLRTDGMSIGFDYFRFEGRPVSFLSPPQLEMEGTIGRGYSSVVRLARTMAENEITTARGTNDNGTTNAGGSDNAEKKPSNSNSDMNSNDNDNDISPSSSSSPQPLHVALKTSQIRNRNKRKMMIKELRVLCRLECDCLVQLIGAFVDEGMITTVLEYMDKGSLADLARHHEDVGGVPRPQLASIAYQMLWGLAFLHHENLLHRDIKPENVLLNSAGYVKLSDFGISSDQVQRQMLIRSNASEEDDDNDDGLNTTLIGTWRYMSPERLQGRPYGTPSDVWSLGLVLLECALGTFPFHEVTSPYELIETIEESTMEELIPISVDEDVRELIASCLRKNAAERVPVERLLKSPLFANEEIASVDDAPVIMKAYYDELDFFIDGKFGS